MSVKKTLPDETIDIIAGETKRNTSVVLTDELYEKINEESFKLRQRSISGTIRVIIEKYFDDQNV